MGTARLFDRYYFSKQNFRDGTERFHGLCRMHHDGTDPILEVGAGPANPTTAFLATLGRVVGLDISSEVLSNPQLAESNIYDGNNMPFAESTFSLCVSNYVLEHVADPSAHFREIFRILKPGGFYCFRTPNRWHYVTLASRALPHSWHLRLTNKLRALHDDAHDPWRTFYRANDCRTLNRLAKTCGLVAEQLNLIEAEPSYGAAHAVLFYPMMAYERLVNSHKIFEPFRVNIFGVLRKPISW
jgi:SAM-dependent methyltransferase